MGSENNKPMNTLARLDDVHCADPREGDVATYDATRQKFVVGGQRQLVQVADDEALEDFGDAQFAGQLAVVLDGPALYVGKADLTWLQLTGS